MATDEGASGQIEDQAAVHLLVEVEVEVVEGLLRVAKLGLLFSSLQQPFAATCQFVGDQAGEEVDWGHGLGLGLAETGFEHGGDHAQPQLSESTIQLDEIHWSRLLSSLLDEIPVVHQFANEGIDLPQGELGTTFEIATDKAVLVHSQFEGRRASVLDRGSAELLRQGEDAQDAADARFSELAIDQVAEGADVRAGAIGSPQ